MKNVEMKDIKSNSQTKTLNNLYRHGQGQSHINVINEEGTGNISNDESTNDIIKKSRTTEISFGLNKNTYSNKHEEICGCGSNHEYITHKDDQRNSLRGNDFNFIKHTEPLMLLTPRRSHRSSQKCKLIY